MADLIKWSDKYSVNNTILDSQHKVLISLINDLHTSMREGKGKQVLQQILDNLVLYTIDHFSTEEQILRKASYPFFKEHKQQHDELTMQATKLQGSYKSGEVPLTQDVLNFLRDWLINHIEGTDQKYKDKIT